MKLEKSVVSDGKLFCSRCWQRDYKKHMCLVELYTVAFLAYIDGHVIEHVPSK